MDLTPMLVCYLVYVVFLSNFVNQLIISKNKANFTCNQEVNDKEYSRNSERYKGTGDVLFEAAHHH